MKHNEKKTSVMIYPGVYSCTIYEMEVWSATNGRNCSNKEYQKLLQEDGNISCGLRKEMVGLFNTRERALQQLEMMCDDPWEDDGELFCAFIRERPMYCMMNQADYLKEWTYIHGWLHDESIVRNYDEEDNPFLGRPEGMINFQVGDIVMVPDDYGGHWGIVAGTPPTEERVKEINEHFNSRTKRKTKRSDNVQSILDWSDDCYLILTCGGGLTCGHEHVLSHHVLPTYHLPPFVSRTLKEGLRKVESLQTVTK